MTSGAGRDVVSGGEVAIKLEHCSTDYPRLELEVQIYESLSGQAGIPQVFWHGSNCEYEAMVFELLGPNLEDVFRFCDNKFSLKTTLMLMDQLLYRIESLHAVGYLHCDIKPENFLLGTGKRGNVVFMTDLGLAACWSSEWYAQSTSQKPPNPPRLSLVGTRRYASINGHLAVSRSDSVWFLVFAGSPSSCIGSSPRDDLESLGYMALYFLRGSLPWQGIQASSREEKDRLVLERKRKTAVADLCDGLPAEFANYMNYVRALGNGNRPNYKYLRTQFNRLFHRRGFEHDNVFDWTIREFEKQDREPPLASRPDQGGRIDGKMKSRAESKGN